MKNTNFKKTLINSLGKQRKFLQDKYARRIGNDTRDNQIEEQDSFSIRNNLINLGYSMDLVLSDVAEIGLKINQIREEMSSFETKQLALLNKFESEFLMFDQNKQQSNSQAISSSVLMEEIDELITLKQETISDFKSNVFLKSGNLGLSELGVYGFYEPIREANRIKYLDTNQLTSNSVINKKIKKIFSLNNEDTYIQFIGKETKKRTSSFFTFYKEFCQCFSNAILIETPNLGIEVSKLFINSIEVVSSAYSIKKTKKGISILLNEKHELNSVRIVLEVKNKIEIDYLLNENDSLNDQISKLNQINSNSWVNPWRIQGDIYFLTIKNIKAFRQLEKETIVVSFVKEIDNPVNTISLEAVKKGYVDARITMSFFKDNSLIETATTTFNPLEVGNGLFVERLIANQVGNKNIFNIAGKPSENLGIDLSIENSGPTPIDFNSNQPGQPFFTRIKDQYILEVNSLSPIKEEYVITYTSEDFNREAISINKHVSIDNEGNIFIELDHDSVVLKVDLFIRNSRYINSYLSEVRIVGK